MMMDEDEGGGETHEEISESLRITRSRKIRRTENPLNKGRRKIEIMTNDEEAATTAEPNNKEEGQ